MHPVAIERRAGGRPALIALTLGVACAAALPGCADDAAPPVAPSSAPLSSWAQERLSHLAAGDPQLRGAAAAIVAIGEPAARAAAGARLVVAARAAAVMPGRDDELLRVLEAMHAVGGPEVVAYCFSLAEDESAPGGLRQAALTVAARHVDPRDTAARARGAALWERVMRPAGQGAAGQDAAVLHRGVEGTLAVGASMVQGGEVANASQSVAGMGAGFRRCYNMGLQEDPRMSGSARITARIGPGGDVISVEPVASGLSPVVVACVAARVSSAKFAPPAGGGATIVIPVTFVAKP